MLSLSIGPTLGSAKGNPSAKATRNDPAFTQKTGLGLGYRLTPTVGAALTDWFSFGLGMSIANLNTDDYRTRVDTFVFHLESFPLYSQGGTWRDLGLSADFGAGVSSIVAKKDDEKVAKSGAASTVGIGIFWEPLRTWLIAAGPHISYQRNWSRWYSRHDVMAGLRVAFYSDQF
jgi:hypothetical protein